MKPKKPLSSIPAVLLSDYQATNLPKPKIDNEPLPSQMDSKKKNRNLNKTSDHNFIPHLDCYCKQPDLLCLSLIFKIIAFDATTALSAPHHA